MLTGQDLTDVGIVGANPYATLYGDGSIVGGSDNGAFIKYPNGELMCYGITATTIGDKAVIFPLAFIASPSLIATSTNITKASIQSISSTSVGIRTTRDDTSGDVYSTTVHWQAIGRWK